MDGTASSITQTGLLRLCGSGFAIAVAYITFYAGLKIIGPVKASMLLNIEPSEIQTPVLVWAQCIMEFEDWQMKSEIN